jgi:dihydroorotase
MPNTIPPTITCENLKRKINSAKKKTIVNLGFHAMLTDKIYELSGMARMGAFSFKLYLNGDQNNFEINDDELLYELMQECEKMKVPLTIHAEGQFEEKGSLNGSLKDLVDLHSKELEINAVKRIIALAKRSKGQIHICHISTFEALALIEKAKKVGLNISCEATPHHLLLSNKSFNELGSLVLTDPPIRNGVNAKKLLKAMINGKIDIVASDHAPHTLKEKLSSNICDIPSGIPGLETTVPLMLTEVNSGRLTLGRLVEVLAEKPSKIFQIQNKGRLKEGMDADLTLIDLKAENVINSKNLHTKSEYSPFEGLKCKGKVSKVILAGEVIVDSGEIIANSGSGKIIRRG